MLQIKKDAGSPFRADALRRVYTLPGANNSIAYNGKKSQGKETKHVTEDISIWEKSADLVLMRCCEHKKHQCDLRAEGSNCPSWFKPSLMLITIYHKKSSVVNSYFTQNQKIHTEKKTPEFPLEQCSKKGILFLRRRKQYSTQRQKRQGESCAFLTEPHNTRRFRMQQDCLFVN